MKNFRKFKNKSVIGPEKEQPMDISALLTTRWVTIKKTLSTKKTIWKLQRKSVIGQEKEQPLEISASLTSY